jgi:hypothetical protein
MVLNCVPDRLCLEASEEMERWGPAIRVACNELTRCEDGVFVEVESYDETVLIAKRGKALVIDVESEDESVHITVPLATVKHVVSKIERINGSGRPSKDLLKFRSI